MSDASSTWQLLDSQSIPPQARQGLLSLLPAGAGMAPALLFALLAGSLALWLYSAPAAVPASADSTKPLPLSGDVAKDEEEEKKKEKEKLKGGAPKIVLSPPPPPTTATTPSQADPTVSTPLRRTRQQRRRSSPTTQSPLQITPPPSYSSGKALARHISENREKQRMRFEELQRSSAQMGFNVRPLAKHCENGAAAADGVDNDGGAALMSFCERLLFTNHVWKQEREIEGLKDELEQGRHELARGRRGLEKGRRELERRKKVLEQERKESEEATFEAFCDKLLMKNTIWKLQKDVEKLEAAAAATAAMAETAAKSGEVDEQSQAEDITKAAQGIMLEVKKEMSVSDKIIQELMDQFTADHKQASQLREAHKREVDEAQEAHARELEELKEMHRREMEEMREVYSRDMEQIERINQTLETMLEEAGQHETDESDEEEEEEELEAKGRSTPIPEEVGNHDDDDDDDTRSITVITPSPSASTSAQISPLGYRRLRARTSSGIPRPSLPRVWQGPTRKCESTSCKEQLGKKAGAQGGAVPRRVSTPNLSLAPGVNAPSGRSYYSASPRLRRVSTPNFNSLSFSHYGQTPRRISMPGLAVSSPKAARRVSADFSSLRGHGDVRSSSRTSLGFGFGGSVGRSASARSTSGMGMTRSVSMTMSLSSPVTMSSLRAAPAWKP